MHVGEEALPLEWYLPESCRSTDIRVDLTTGVSEYKEYLDSLSWQLRLALRTCGGDGTVHYPDTVSRKWPRSIWPARKKLKPESVPLFPGHKEVTA